MSGQRTIRRSATLEGVGLHSGRAVTMTVKPASPDTGIVFVRTDLNPAVSIRVAADKVSETMLATTLSEGAVSISTIEHFMSVLNGFGIDNIVVEVNAPELPIMDGSGYDFVALIDRAGLVDKPTADKRFIRILEPCEVTDGDKFARLEPYEGLAFDFTINFGHPVIDKTVQHVSVDLCYTTYREAISYARTFGFLADVKKLQSMGLALGGSLDNAIVIDENGIVNAEGLRADDEFVKHKILDAMGDLYVLGRPLLARYVGYKSGHALNNRLIRKIIAREVRFELVKFGEGIRRPKHYDMERMIP
ncbi:MAG TPA: UDP-3-O-[3-hydroxymyristoyl] N-acetylglucosamine deacetylase [Sutterella sp.]|nr:UDP-3-O-[3-hydroxymyristoyl] N-acetylglucosamine deacetylase [Sutterella sp.]